MSKKYPGESDKNVFARVASREVRLANERADKRLKFVKLIARMKTEAEFGDDAPPSEDYMGITYLSAEILVLRYYHKLVLLYT